jgi:uncharacterized protein (TIGR00369 family)
LRTRRELASGRWSGRTRSPPRRSGPRCRASTTWVHGGYAATALDSALGCAVHTTLPAGTGYTSLGLEVKYVRPITRDTGRVLCEGPVLYRGRRQATAEATLTAAASGKLVATGTATLMILSG